MDYSCAFKSIGNKFTFLHSDTVLVFYAKCYNAVQCLLGNELITICEHYKLLLQVKFDVNYDSR